MKTEVWKLIQENSCINPFDCTLVYVYVSLVQRKFFKVADLIPHSVWNKLNSKELQMTTLSLNWDILDTDGDLSEGDSEEHRFGYDMVSHFPTKWINASCSLMIYI